MWVGTLANFKNLLVKLHAKRRSEVVTDFTVDEMYILIQAVEEYPEYNRLIQEKRELEEELRDIQNRLSNL